jgi:hypothetical protein
MQMCQTWSYGQLLRVKVIKFKERCRTWDQFESLPRLIGCPSRSLQYPEKTRCSTPKDQKNEEEEKEEEEDLVWEG